MLLCDDPLLKLENLKIGVMLMYERTSNERKEKN